MALQPLLPHHFVREARGAILDFAFYRRVFQQSFRRSLLYLLQLTILASLVYTLVYSVRLIPRLDDFLSWARSNFPPFSIEQGQLHVDVESPATFIYPGQQLYTFVFDTREDHVLPASLDQPAIILTRDKLYLSYLGQPVTWAWPQIEALFANTERGVVVNPTIIEEVRQNLGWMTPAFFFCTLGISIVGKLLQAILLTFFGISASTSQGIRLPYTNYLTIAFYALTPAVAIDLLVVILGQNSDLFQLIYLVTAAVYTYLATRRCVTIE